MSGWHLNGWSDELDRQDKLKRDSYMKQSEREQLIQIANVIDAERRRKDRQEILIGAIGMSILLGLAIWGTFFQ